MWGPTEFYVTGNLRSYDRTGQLHELELPVLLLAGEFDEARPETIREFAHLIPGARFELVEGRLTPSPSINRSGSSASCGISFGGWSRADFASRTGRAVGR
jgi:hypothetical protein